MADDFGGGQSAKLSAGFNVFPGCESIEESGSKLVTCAGGVDDFGYRRGGYFISFFTVPNDRAFFAARHGGDFDMFADSAGGIFKIILHEEGFYFFFVGEENIDVAFYQPQEVGAVAVNAEWV